ncbi:MAG: molybdopterin-dependent oxidoreductase [Propionibacteriales bacterium]|nr:molybdopterin-dependent oxidoreductase [Propionibacteriales bacterium]
MATEVHVGRRMARKEDRPLVTGTGRFVADIRPVGTVDVAFGRSPVAHARIEAIGTEAATAMDGVVGVYTAPDIQGQVQPFTLFVDQEHTPPSLDQSIHPVIRPCDMDVLALTRVRYVGQPVVAIVAESRYLAEDAAELVDIDYEELPVLTDPEAAIAPGAPLLHEQVPGNVQASFDVDLGAVDAVFAEAEHTASFRFLVPRVAGSPIETRGVLAVHDPVQEELTVWSSTQTPYMVRTRIAEMLGLAEQQVRVIAPDVGGGFGPKVQVYPEEILVAHLSMRLGRPVCWIEDRNEHLVATGQSRDQVHTVEVAYRGDGTITGLRDRFLLDCGAFNPFSITCAYNTAAHLRGLYRVPAYRIRGECVLTNKTPNVPYRGAGRPEATFVMDRVVDVVARRLGLDPAEVIGRNLLTVAEMPCDRGMPYRDGAPIVYDCGDVPASFDRLLRQVGYAEHRSATREVQDGHVRRGIGFATYVEGTGKGPHEGARALLDSRGDIIVLAGCTPHGQSHETAFSQVAADALGVSPEQITFRAGDTALVPYGVGTFASRSAVTAGTAVAVAGGRLRQRILAVAGELLEAAPDDLEFQDSTVHVQGDVTSSVTLHQIAAAAAPGPAARLPAGMDHGMDESYYFVPPTVTFASGLMAAVVDVDTETGVIDVRKIVLVHDSGRLINPMVVEGQIHGGVAQGVGTALYERLVYDDTGQPLTTTFMDYLLPTSMEVPKVEQIHVETRSDRNPLGVKGVGEAGTISPPPAIVNAVVDALAPLSVEFSELPLTPEVVLDAVLAARSGRTGGQR